MGDADLLHRQRQLGEGGQRVAAAAHRRGSGVGGKALQGDVEPALAHCRVNEADINAFFFQNRPLFDMHFVAGVERAGGGRTLPAIADSLQRLADADAVAIFAGEREGLAKLPGPDAGRQHRRGKARPFFVGPVHQHDIAFGRNAAVVQRAQRLQPGEDAVNAVIAAAERLGIDVRTGQYRGQMRMFTAAANKHIPHTVDFAGEASFTRPLAQQIARLAVLFAKRQSGHAARRRGAELRHLVERRPQTCAVDGYHGLSFFTR